MQQQPIIPLHDAHAYELDDAFALALLEQCRVYVNGDSNDKCLLLVQPAGIATALEPLLRWSVRFVGSLAMHCTPNRIWTAGTHDSSKQALVRFLQQCVAPVCKGLFQRVASDGAPNLASALQALDGKLIVDNTHAKRVAEQLALALQFNGEVTPFDRNGAVLASYDGSLYEYDYSLAIAGGLEIVVRQDAISAGDFVRRTLPYALLNADDYDGAAVARLEAIMHTALPLDGDIRRFWAHLLATIAFSAPMTDGHVFVLLGETASGKTTLIELLRALFGEYAVALPESLLYDKKFKKSAADEALAGARLAYVDDPTAPMSVELLKRLTNRDGADGTHRCHIVIAAQEAKFRAVLGNAAESIGSRVSVIALSKRFVAPREHSIENDGTHPLAKTSAELFAAFRGGAPLLMHKLLVGAEDVAPVIASCAALYCSERTPLPRCDKVRRDTQRLLEPPDISEQACVKMWLDGAMRKESPNVLPLLVREEGASAAVSALFSAYKRFVDDRRRHALAVPANAVREHDDNDKDCDPGNDAHESRGAARKRNSGASSESGRKRSKSKLAARLFVNALKATLKTGMTVEKTILGYRWTAEQE